MSATPRTHPILFSGEMVCAILQDRKSATRRVIRPQPSDDGLEWRTAADGAFAAWEDPMLLLDEHSEDGGPCQRQCPYGEPGDLLYLRETWKPVEQESGIDGIIFKADGGFREIENHLRAADMWVAVYDDREWRWRSSIHMPRWASRLTQRISNVRVERVQNISIEDIHAEGVACSDCWTIGTEYADFPHAEYCGCRNLFTNLIDSINGPRGYLWADNYWVWIIEWNRVWRQNVDEVMKDD